MLTKGDKIIAGTGTITPLLTSIWSDHILNDISWLRADTFSWQSGDVYTAAYQHLLADIDGKELQSETIGDITIEFYLANDGHKITTDEEKVATIYNQTGVAWYYILDRANRRFKLPRTKFGFTGLRDSVGGYVEPGLPDHRHSLVTKNQTMPWAGNNGVVWYAETTGYTGYASADNPIYGNSNTVQPPATQMYLYFYVGQFTQTAVEQTAGITTEVMGTKVDKGHEVIAFQAPTAENNYTWYRKYASGWVEQGGIYTGTVDGMVNETLPIEMQSDNYQVTINRVLKSNTSDPGTATIDRRCFMTNGYTTTKFRHWGIWATWGCSWQVSGMAKQN